MSYRHIILRLEMHLQRYVVDDYNLFISDHAASQASVMPGDFNSKRKKEQIKGGMFRQIGVKNAFQLFFFFFLIAEGFFWE